MKPADVVEIEVYSDEEIALWDEEDRLNPIEREGLLKNLKSYPDSSVSEYRHVSHSNGLRIFLF